MNNTDQEHVWAIVSLMGHRTHAGRVREVEVCGVKLLRIEVPTGPDTFAAPLDVAPQALYAVQWCTEEQARGRAGYVTVPLLDDGGGELTDPCEEWPEDVDEYGDPIEEVHL